MCFPFPGVCASLGREKMLIFNLYLVYRAIPTALYRWPVCRSALCASFTAVLCLLVDFLVKILGIEPIFFKDPC